ncbi:condensin subunit ScpB [Bifidobacterium bohemicum]|uniref:Segregation and condensation protein B n=2 Tax=Bifidobacterium bohemicum TaxID=638617 RepID=A0A086ZG98_9BIFI|nr:segregation and condensation protein B [Bifidobacterium bohemicum DSM 22767]SCC02181.1 condensin subunit ScpB [Bifidobacterium bohemicum]
MSAGMTHDDDSDMQTIEQGADRMNATETIAEDGSRAVSRPEYVDFDVEDFPGGLLSCLEAILMVVDRPIDAEELAHALALEAGQVERALRELKAQYDGDSGNNIRSRGFELRHSARGWQLANRAVYEPVVSAFVADGQVSRLSQAALEALAIVAYKQPITRAQIAAIRGVNSDGVVRVLSVRGLIAEQGTDPDSRAALLVTTGLFLEKMGLDSLDRLPALAPFLPQESDVLDEAE